MTPEPDQRLLYLRREKKKVRRPFKTKREAQAWRSEALTAARKGELRRAPKDHRTVYEALVYRRAIDREDWSKRPRRIVAPDEAARLIELLPLEDRALWGTAFHAVSDGRVASLCCEDIDLARNLIHVRKGWDREEGEIEPKSGAAKRTIRPLAIFARARRESPSLLRGQRREIGFIGLGPFLGSKCLQTLGRGDSLLFCQSLSETGSPEMSPA
jgi:hypothetical protein